MPISRTKAQLNILLLWTFLRFPELLGCVVVLKQREIIAQYDAISWAVYFLFFVLQPWKRHWLDLHNIW